MYTARIEVRWQTRPNISQNFTVKSTTQNRRRKITMSQISKMAPVLTLAAASLALTFAFAGCNKSPDNTAQTQPGAAPAGQSQDPAASANLAPVSAQPATYDQQAPNANPQRAPNSNYQQQPNYSNNDSRNYPNRDSRDSGSHYNDGNYNDSGSYDSGSYDRGYNYENSDDD